MKKKSIPGVDYIGVTICFYCVNGEGELLLHKRSENCRDECGRWDAGGGQLEFGETPEEGVLREVREEYGCEGEIIGQIPAISVLRDQNGIETHWLALPFIVKIDPKKVKNNEPDKISELGWFRLNNLPEPLHSALDKYILKTKRVKILQKFLTQQ